MPLPLSCRPRLGRQALHFSVLSAVTGLLFSGCVVEETHRRPRNEVTVVETAPPPPPPQVVYAEPPVPIPAATLTLQVAPPPRAARSWSCGPRPVTSGSPATGPGAATAMCGWTAIGNSRRAAGPCGCSPAGNIATAITSLAKTLALRGRCQYQVQVRKRRGAIRAVFLFPGLSSRDRRQSDVAIHQMDCFVARFATSAQ